MYYPQCSKEVTDLIHTCDPCNNVERGRVRSLIMIDPSYEDLQDLLERPDEQNYATAVDAGKAFIIPRVIGSFDGGTPVEGDGYGDETSRLIGYNYALDAKDPSYAANVAFWQAAEKKNWYLVFRTETLIHFVTYPTKVQAKAPVEEGLDSDVVWNLHFTWAGDEKPTIKSADLLDKFWRNDCVRKGTAPLEQVRPS